MGKIQQQNMKRSQIRKPLNQKTPMGKNMVLKTSAEVGTSVNQVAIGQSSPTINLNDANFQELRPRLIQVHQQDNNGTNYSFFAGVSNIMPGVLLRNNLTNSSAQTALLNSPVGPSDERNAQQINTPNGFIISKRGEVSQPDSAADVITIVSPLQRRAFTVQQSLSQNQNVKQVQQNYDKTMEPKQQPLPMILPTPKIDQDVDFNEHIRQQLLKKPEEKLPQIRRVFLRSQVHCWERRDAQLNYSDGIVVPHTLFNILTDRQHIQVTNHFYGKNLPLYVTVSDTRTFFNVNMNILHRHQLAAQIKDSGSVPIINGGRSQSAEVSQKTFQGSSGNIKCVQHSATEIMARIYSIHEVSTKARNLNHTQTQKAEKLHQARQINLLNTSKNNKNQQLQQPHLEELHSEDDDTVYMPEWIFEKLKIIVGDPVCLIFNFEINKAMCGLQQAELVQYGIASEVTFSIKGVERSKMRQKRIFKNGDQFISGVVKPSQEYSTKLYPEGLEINESIIERDFLKQFEVGLKSFKTLKVGDNLPVYLKLSNETIWVTIEDINSLKDDKQLFLNSHPQGSTQTLVFHEFNSFVSQRYSDIQQERSLAALRKNANNEPSDEQLLQMDLNEIVHKKGLRDLDLIEKVLAAKQRREVLVRERRRQIQLKVEEAAREHRLMKSPLVSQLNRASSIKVSPSNNSPLMAGFKKQKLENKIRTEELQEEDCQPIIKGNIDLSKMMDEQQKLHITEKSRIMSNVNSQNDSNLQKFTFDKNDDIRVKIERQTSDNNGLFSSRYLKVSHSSKTLVGSPQQMDQGKHKQSEAVMPTSQELLMIDKQLIKEEEAHQKEFQNIIHIVKVPPSEVFKDTLTADQSRQEVAEAIADYQKKSTKVIAYPPNEKIMTPHTLQRMQVEFRSKKSGTSVLVQQKQNFGTSLFGQRRKSSNFQLQIYRDSSPQNFRSKHQLLNPDEVEFLQIINSKEPQDINGKMRELKNKYNQEKNSIVKGNGMVKEKNSQRQLSELFETVPLHTDSIMNINNNSFQKQHTKQSTFIKNPEQEVILCPNFSQRSLKRQDTRDDYRKQFKTVLSGNCIMRRPVVTTQGLENRPKSVFMEQRLTKHLAMKKISGQQQNDKLVLKSQLDQLVFDKRQRVMSGQNQYNPSKMNAVLNRQNQAIDKNRTMNNFYRANNSLKESQAIVIRKPLNKNLKQKQKDLIDDLEMAIKTPRNQQIVIPNHQNQMNLTTQGVHHANQNGDSTTNQSNSFLQQPIMPPATDQSAVVTLTQGGLSNIQIIQRGGGKDNQSMFQNYNSRIQKQQASVSIPENASNRKMKQWIKIPHSQHLSFSQVKPIHPQNQNSSKKANGSKAGGGKSSSVISKKNMNNSQMTLLDNELLQNNQAQLQDEDHLMLNDNIGGEDLNNYKMSNVSRYENLISEQIGDLTDISPDNFSKVGILGNKMNGLQIVSPHTIQKMMDQPGQLQHIVQEKVFFGIPSPQMIDDDFTLTSGNQHKTSSMPLSPQSADFSYMFKQEIHIDGKPHNAALLDKVTSYLQKKKKSEQQQQHFYLNNPSTNYHLKPHPVLKGPKYAKTQRVIKVPEGTSIPSKKIEIDDNYYQIQASSANALKHPLNDQYYYRSRSISPQNMSPTSIDQQLSGTYVGIEQRREKGLKTLCPQQQQQLSSTQKQQISSKSQAIHQQVIKNNRRNILRPKTQINTTRGLIIPQSPVSDYKPMSVRGQGKAKEIKLFKFRRNSKEPQFSQILTRDGVQVAERIKKPRFKDSDYVETRNVEIQQTSTLLNEQQSISINAAPIVVTPEELVTAKTSQNARKRHISLILK